MKEFYTKDVLEKVIEEGTPNITLGDCHYFIELNEDNREVIGT